MKKLILTLAIVGLGYCVNAQPGAGAPGTTPTPFGFVELLMAAGAAFGGKKIYDAKKKNQV